MKALVLLALVGMVVLSVPSVRDQVEQQFYPRKYQAFVEQWAQVYQLDPLLVYSFIRTESGFDPDATSTVATSEPATAPATESADTVTVPLIEEEPKKLVRFLPPLHRSCP